MATRDDSLTNLRAVAAALNIAGLRTHGGLTAADSRRLSSVKREIAARENAGGLRPATPRAASAAGGRSSGS